MKAKTSPNCNISSSIVHQNLIKNPSFIMLLIHLVKQYELVAVINEAENYDQSIDFANSEVQATVVLSLNGIFSRLSHIQM